MASEAPFGGAVNSSGRFTDDDVHAGTDSAGDSEGLLAGHSDVPEDAFREQKSIALNDAVANMSISPSGRDLVLAARAGMYIVDLENTRDTPRFLPQGATWEVADVQWNPHHSNSELIVSTSNQKLVIWNLRLTGMTSIQHILHGHFRAITDINWHPLRENIVASISIDGWTMIWDVRDRMKKDVMRMTTWEDAGTQVKWNYKHPHILASAHKGHVQLWDDRKGAVPLKTIYAHHSKIYGIDWSRVAPDELITCSLDSSIKRFDTSRPEDDSDSQTLTPPSGVIQTANPVWRARHLPFGRGVLSLPHRGSYTLEMYEFGNEEESVVDFERTALVKEYVWRSRGGTDPSFDDREFQLVTLATDRTVKLEYIPPTVLERTGWRRGGTIPLWIPRRTGESKTYRDPPAQTTDQNFLLLDERLVTAATRRTVVGSNPQLGSLLTAPFTRYKLAAEATLSSSPDASPAVRPPPPPPTMPIDITNTEGTTPTQNSRVDKGGSATPNATATIHANGKTIKSTVVPRQTPRYTMTLAPKTKTARNKRRGVDQLSWFSSVRLDRDPSSVGPLDRENIDDEDDVFDDDGDSDADENDRSESWGLESQSRPTSRALSHSAISASTGGTGWNMRSRSRLRSMTRIETETSRTGTGGSGSIGAGGKDSRSNSPLPHDAPQDLAEEVAQVVKKLGGLVQHEKTDTTKSKKCVFSLRGPWGSHMAPTFIRVTFFNFPSTYPRPSSLLRKSRPSVEIEKGSSDIPRSKRHALLRDLKKILEKEAPALELCLLYLLGKYELQDPDAALNGSGTVPGWDDDETSLIPGLPDDSGLPIPLLRDHYALPKNRHTQGIFGPNGKLIILSRRASPLSAPGSRPDSPSGSISNFSSVVPSTSGTLLDAMWGLSRLAVDREYIKRDFADVGRPRRANFTDSLILKPYIRPRTRDTRPAPPLTNVDIVSTADYGGIIDLDLTSAFDLAPSTSIVQFAAHALELCRPLRPDIAQVWNVILSVISKAVEPAEVTGPLMTNRPINPKLRAIIQRDLMQVIGAVYDELLRQKDIQMLAMLSVLLLKLDTALSKASLGSLQKKLASSLAPASSANLPSIRLQLDFYSHRLSSATVHAPAPPKPPTPRAPSQPVALTNSTSPPHTPHSGPSSTSKGSWSSILSRANYPTFLGGSSGSSGARKPKTSFSGHPRRGSTSTTADEAALANVPPNIAAALAELKRRRMTRAEPERPQTVPGVLSKIPESGGAGPPISSHSAGNTSTPSPASIHSRRTESVHAQMQAATSPPGMGAMMMSMRIPPTHSTTLPLHTHRHGRLLSMGSQGGGGGGGGQTISLTMPIVSSRPAKIQAEFSEPATNIPPLLTPELRVQLESHLRAYGEALRQLGMLTQRAELMNFSRDWELDAEKNITMISLCKACGRKAHARGTKCRATRTTGGTPEPRCTVCHLPVKKLGRTCLRCTHVSHQSCLRTLPSKIAALCPSGCGCRCAEAGGWFEADRTPPPPHVHRHHSGHGHRHAHSSSSRSTAGPPRR